MPCSSGTLGRSSHPSDLLSSHLNYVHGHKQLRQTQCLVPASIFCPAALLIRVTLGHITFKWYLQVSCRHASSPKQSQDLLGNKLCIDTNGERQALLGESLKSKFDVCVCLWIAILPLEMQLTLAWSTAAGWKDRRGGGRAGNEVKYCKPGEGYLMIPYRWSFVLPLQYSRVTSIWYKLLYKMLAFVHAILCEFPILAWDLDPEMMVSFIVLWWQMCSAYEDHRKYVVEGNCQQAMSFYAPSAVPIVIATAVWVFGKCPLLP